MPEKNKNPFFFGIKNEIQLNHNCTGGISQQNGSVLVFMISFSNLILLSRTLGYLLIRKFHILKNFLISKGQKNELQHFAKLLLKYLVLH